MTKFDKDKKDILYAIDTILQCSPYLCFLSGNEKKKQIKYLKKIRKHVEKEKYDKVMNRVWLNEFKEWEK